MTDTWDRTLFDKELKSILETKLPVSASKISSLQHLATAHPQHHNYIIQCITRFIETAPPDYRLAGLYVIDAISRAVHKQMRKREELNEAPSVAEGYLKRFTFVLKDDSLIGCFEPCSTKDKEKVKKTLDFWEQGAIYSKDMVQYVKHSFLKSRENVAVNEKKDVPAPAIDAALLLQTLSNIGNGSLSNLNIPGAIVPPPTSSVNDATPPPLPSSTTTTTAPTTTTASSADQQALPPALAKLLGGIVTTSSPSPSPVPLPPVATTHVSADPRIRDPRVSSNSPIANTTSKPTSSWPPPQGPSIPSNRSSSERKSRWGNDTPVVAQPTPQAPPQTQQLQQHQDPWLIRQSIPDSRLTQQQQPQQQQDFQRQNYQPYQQYQNSYQQQQQQQPLQSNYQPQYMQYQQHQQSKPMYQHQQHQQQRHQQHHQQQHQQQQQEWTPPVHPMEKGEDPSSDPTLPAGCIKVLTRSLFVGPIPDYYEKNDVVNLFEKYGELASVIVSKKSNRRNAFLKFTTRAATEAALNDGAGLVVEDVPVKVNWAFGFGPKKHFNYDRGESIIPLHELSNEEKENLVTAPVGGFRGQPVRDQMTIEEPEVEYKPEWKKTDNKSQHEDHRKRPHRHEDYSASTRKRGRTDKRMDYISNANFTQFNDAPRGHYAYPEQ